MKRCKAKTKTGAPCSASAGADGFCNFHSPALGAARAEGRKRGGARHRVPHSGDANSIPREVRTLQDVLAVLDYTLAEAVPMENSVQRLRALVAICGAYVDAIKVGELEARLTALEAAI